MQDKVVTFIIEPILSDDETTVSLRATPHLVDQNSVQDINVESLHQLLKNRGYGKFKIDSDTLKEVVKTLESKGKNIVFEEDVNTEKFETETVAQAIDALGEVAISQDKMLVDLSITPAQGGKDFSIKQVMQLLSELGIEYGIDDEKLADILNKSRLSTEDTPNTGPIAFGLEPIKGEDARFEPLVDTANERILKPKLRPDGTVDMLDLGDLATVSVDTPLMQKHPPQKGTDGVNVLNEVIEAELGDDFPFKPGSGTKISDSDETLLVSTIAGQPNLLDRGMKVDDAVQVKSVDITTGHMTLDANLMIKGDIAEGMKVRCAGDITVGGVIECADVKAGGNIRVGKGIIGRMPEHTSNENQYKVKVKAEGNLSATFASYAQIEVTEKINIAEQLLHCNTTAQSDIKIGNEKTVGSQIVGGFTRSDTRVEADILGASAGILTNIDMNGVFDIKHYEVACSRSIIDGKTVMLTNMHDAYSKFMNLPQNDAIREHMGKIKNTINFIINEIKQLEEQTVIMLLEGEEVCDEIRVVAKKKIHPNVVVKIGHEKLKITRERASGYLHYENGEIHYKPQV